MQPFLSMADNRAVDNYAIHSYGIPGESLMEAAGKAVVLELLKGQFLTPSSQVLILAGKGNNGGDGYVIASDLILRGYHVTVISVVAQDAVRGDARIHLDRLLESEPDFTVWQDTADQKARFESADLIVDALLGTGVKGDLREPYLDLINRANQSRAITIAIDVPSGVTGDLGDVLEPCIQAEMTISMGFGKQTCLFEPARSHAGKIIPVDIGFPEDSLNHINGEILYRLASEDMIPQEYTRASDVHKYQSGKVFILAGSRGFSGAAILATKAALRSGGGLVKLSVPASIGEIAESALIEAVVAYLPETEAHTISLSNLADILEDAEWSDVTAIGPGLGRHPETVELVLQLTEQISRPLVLDADGLHAIATRPEVLKKRSAPTILTPHVGEFKRLADLDPSATPNWRDAQAFAREYAVFLLLKGAPSLLVSPQGHVFVNPTGNPGMATGGSGDVLTGILAALWSQWPENPNALKLGMFKHGEAADCQKQEKGILGLIAGDIIEGLPMVLKEYGDLPH